MRSVYEFAKTDKKLAASILLPLIEFEFCFIAEDTPMLVQSKRNKKQLEKIFEVCKSHGWASKIVPKGDNLGFKLHRSAFKEIYSMSGEFADPNKNEWAKLILEREGMKGGFMWKNKSTSDRILSVMKKDNKWWSIGELCSELRLMPSTIRETLRELVESTRKVENKRDGKRILWKYRDSALDTLPEKRAG